MSPQPTRHFWVALRSDGNAGTGSETDPFDAGSVQKLNNLFENFRNYGDNLTIHFAPGTYYGDRQWQPKNNWNICGAGIDRTIFKTKANPAVIGTVGFCAGSYEDGPTDFHISDVTFDFNVPELRKANRAFVYQTGAAPHVYYFYAADLPEWSPSEIYSRKGIRAVRYQDNEYIAVRDSRNKRPGQGIYWSILRPNRAEELPDWIPGKHYVQGDAIMRNGKAYICKLKRINSDAAIDARGWQLIAADMPDPLILTRAVFICSRPPAGNHQARSVKAINGHGSRFFDRESFNIGLGGNNCLIEECQVKRFHGDYSTLIVVFFGQGSIVRGCRVRGNDGMTTMGYGGWACWETIFENNFAADFRSATNIDSLTSHDVTFRNNEFLNCREAGILVNVNGRRMPGFTDETIPIDGQEIPMTINKLDGLLVSGNRIQVRDGATFSAIQLQQRGLSNVQVIDNIISRVSGKPVAIGIPAGVRNVVITGNTCDVGMTARVRARAICRDNYDTDGKTIRGL